MDDNFPNLTRHQYQEMQAKQKNRQHPFKTHADDFNPDSYYNAQTKSEDHPELNADVSSQRTEPYQQRVNRYAKNSPITREMHIQQMTHHLNRMIMVLVAMIIVVYLILIFVNF